MKTRKEILTDLYNKTLVMLIDSEVQIDYLKKQDPKMVLFSKPVERINELTKQRYIQKVDFTAEMVVKQEEGKVVENKAVLAIIEEKLKIERKEI